MRVMRTGVGLLVLWLLLSGHYTPLMISFGLVSCFFVAWLASRMNILDILNRPFGFFLRYLAYLPWLIMEIIKSNLHVAKLIWSPRMQINPQVIMTRARQKTGLGLALHANSITLTPGTLSMDIRGDQIEVHALTDEIAEGLASGEFDRRALKVEGEV